MIGVDSSVLLRHLLDDDAQQKPLVDRFFAGRSADDPAFVSLVTLAETVWVLGRLRRLDPSAIRSIVSAILVSQDIVVEQSAAVRRALLDSEEAGTGIADALIAHAAIEAGCDGTVTFDRRAQRLPGMLPVD